MSKKRYDPIEDLRPVHTGSANEKNAEVSSPYAEAPLAFDVYRVADELCIDFDIPGVDPAAIHLALENQFLTVSVQRELDASGIEVIERGRVHGSFEQRLILPGHWHLNELRASYNNGVLHVTAPLRSPEATRTIEVKVSEPVRTSSFSFDSTVGDSADPAEVDANVRRERVGSVA
jgi:HSP20 family protein